MVTPFVETAETMSPAAPRVGSTQAESGSRGTSWRRISLRQQCQNLVIVTHSLSLKKQRIIPVENWVNIVPIQVLHQSIMVKPQARCPLNLLTMM